MKTWKKVASAALAAMVFASLTAGCGGGDKKKEAANSNEIVVGASFELTGNVANYGKSTLSGLKMDIISPPLRQQPAVLRPSDFSLQ